MTKQAGAQTVSSPLVAKFFLHGPLFDANPASKHESRGDEAKGTG
jgi:hypothetical protein